jgi:hypothetical protein
MPRRKGKAKYKFGVFIVVVKEKLSQGAIKWQEIAALYQFWSLEGILRNHEDIKH